MGKSKEDFEKIRNEMEKNDSEDEEMKYYINNYIEL